MSSLNIPELCAQVYTRVFSSLFAAGHPLGVASQRAWQAHDRAHDDLTGHAPADQPAPRPDLSAEWLRELYSRIVDAPAVGSSLVAERYRLLSADRVAHLELASRELGSAWTALGKIAAAAGVSMEGADAEVADAVIAHPREIRDTVIARLAVDRRELTALRAQRDAALRTIESATEMLERWQAPGDGVVLHLCAAGARAHIDRQAARIAELEDAAEKAARELAEAKAARDHFAQQAAAHEAALAVADVVRDEAKRRCFRLADTNLAHVAANMFDTDRENFEHLDAALKAAEVDQPSDLVVWCRAARRLESQILAAGQVGEAVRRFAQVGEALSKVLAPATSAE